ncbi:MAG: HAD family phosphatase [Candidatus Saccharimonadales bacterium]
MIKAIVFDCFGVLIANDLHGRVEAINNENPEAGQALRDVMKARDRGMLSRTESTKLMSDIMGVDPTSLRESIDKGMSKNTALITIIRSLKSTYKIALLSNVSGRDRLDELFDPGELDEVFETVVASGDEGIIKPEREIYELTAERLGVAPEVCVMIDDIPEYCQGANAAGMQAIQFFSTEQFEKDFAALIDSEGQTD